MAIWSDALALLGDLGAIIANAEAARFVGRENEIESFRQYVNLTPPTYIIFYITGQGGVGKTALVRGLIASGELQIEEFTQGTGGRQGSNVAAGDSSPGSPFDSAHGP